MNIEIHTGPDAEVKVKVKDNEHHEIPEVPEAPEVSENEGNKHFLQPPKKKAMPGDDKSSGIVDTDQNFSHFISSILFTAVKELFLPVASTL